MIRRLLVIAFTLALTACETNTVNRDYDPGRDYAAYRNWTWAQPAVSYKPEDPRLKSDLTDQRIKDAVSGQLDQRGLRPATVNGPADLQVRAYLITDERHGQTMRTDPYWGSPWGYWGPWGSGGYTQTQTFTYQVTTLQIDLLDRRDGKLVWRGSTELSSDQTADTPAQRTTAINTAISKILAQYPPR
ncbi:DUF4136 domain-containing protein [Pseudomonas asuensis]|uniref:DUF4136 domain-containing protein n=1 Tax=Pseudomonas asuensis TaxID=1825787 RepID=A0ABQ2GH38_9PSED|nr:DUF4136 domain-containing protein [Pseudomonas asuensis]GGL96167.1 hypothetical protein GCM10009425_03930 [Pseudomonas asuensis]